jgi:hypothetical protein
MATEAVELAQRTGDEELRFHALQADLVASLGPDLDPEEQLRRSREIVVLADRLSAGTSMLSATQLHQGALLQLGQIDAFCDGVELIADIADQLAMPAFSYWSLVYRTTIASLRGDFEEAEALAGRAFSAGQVIDESAALAIFGTEMIAISWAKGTLASLVDGADSLVRQFPRLPSFRAALTFMLAELGADGARESFDYFAAGRFEGVPRDDMWLMSMSMLSLACARLEDAEAAKVMLGQMEPYASRIVAPFTAIVCLGSAAAPIGLLARTAGRFDEADAYLAEAVERNLSLGATPLAALALWEQADCRRRMEDPAGFRRLAARSRQLAIESAMSGLLGRMAAEESLNS